MDLFATGGVFNDEGGRSSGYVRQLFDALGLRLGDGFRSINGGSFDALQALTAQTRDAQVSHVLWLADVPNDKPKLVNGLQRDGMALCISKNNRRGAYSVDDLVERMARAGASALIEFRGEGRAIEARLLGANGQERSPWSPSVDDLAFALHQWAMTGVASRVASMASHDRLARVYVEGARGTMGSLVSQALAQDPRVELLAPLPHQDGASPERCARLAQADLVIVCADGAAVDEIERLAPQARLLDVSAARRHTPGWVYALPEIAGARAALRGAMRAANPGCFATAAILCLEPLVRANLVDPRGAFAFAGIGGYSTGGRSMVDRARRGGLTADTLYGLTAPHPHVAEIQTACGLAHAPAFFPTVGCFERGMMVQVHLPRTRHLSVARVEQALDHAFASSPTVRRVPSTSSRLALDSLVGTDRAELLVIGGEATVSVLCVLDNLGKGGALAAVRNVELMLGLDRD